MKRLTLVLVASIAAALGIGLASRYDRSALATGPVSGPAIVAGTLVTGGPAGARAFESAANTFDPTSSGLARPRGSTLLRADGSTAWIKTGAANTAWTAVANIGAPANSGTTVGRSATYVLIDFQSLSNAIAYVSPTWTANAYRRIRVELNGSTSGGPEFVGVFVNNDTGTNYEDHAILIGGAVGTPTTTLENSGLGSLSYARACKVSTTVGGTATGNCTIDLWPLKKGNGFRTGTFRGYFSADSGTAAQMQAREGGFTWSDATTDATQIRLTLPNGNGFTGDVYTWGLP